MVSNFRIFFNMLKIPTMSLTPLSQTPQVQLPPQSLARRCHWYTAETDLAVCLKPQNKKIELSIRLFLRNRNHIGKIPLLTCQSVPRGVSWAKNCGGRGYKSRDILPLKVSMIVRSICSCLSLMLAQDETRWQPGSASSNVGSSRLLTQKFITKLLCD